jgi:hypothetical protein
MALMNRDFNRQRFHFDPKNHRGVECMQQMGRCSSIIQHRKAQLGSNANMTDKETQKIVSPSSPSMPSISDHSFLPGCTSISAEPKVHRAVEEAVQWACQVVRLQELSGQTPGSLPTLSMDNLESEDLQAAALHVVQANETFKQITDLFLLSFQQNWGSALANNIDAMNLGPDQPEVAWILRHAQECACTNTLIPQEFARKKVWRSRFGSAKWGKFQEDKPLFAHLALISSAISRGDDDLEVFEDGPESDALLEGGMDVQAMVNLQGSIVQPGSIQTHGLVDKPSALTKVARKVMSLSAISRDHFARAIVLPRLFSHEELEGLSLQCLHDIPKNILLLLDANLSEEYLETAATQVLKRGVGGCHMADVELLARSRVHYFIAIVYTQTPESPHSLFQSGGPWPEPLEMEDQASLDDVIAPSIGSVMDGDIDILTLGLDVFFYALRDGVRRQRAQAALEQIAMTLGSTKETPDNCYYAVESERIDPEGPQSLVVHLFDGWFEKIGDIPWPLVTFDSPENQVFDLKKLFDTLGFKPKQDIILVKQEGFA